jgi:hypothetical protein
VKARRIQDFGYGSIQRISLGHRGKSAVADADLQPPRWARANDRATPNHQIERGN